MTQIKPREYYVWSGDWRPQGTPERPYAHTESYILIPEEDGLPQGVQGVATTRRVTRQDIGNAIEKRAFWMVILSPANEAALKEAGISLYQPVRG